MLTREYPIFLLSSMCFFPAIFLETTSLLFRYHSVTTVSPSNTFPVLSCYFLYFSLFLLRKSKKCSNFATANPKFADILLKAFISACFRDSKSCKISSYLKQEGSKRPLGYDYPAHRASFRMTLFGGIHISAWALVAYSCCKVFPVPLTEE